LVLAFPLTEGGPGLPGWGLFLPCFFFLLLFSSDMEVNLELVYLLAKISKIARSKNYSIFAPAGLLPQHEKNSTSESAK
jgi:hypothetical protein